MELICHDCGKKLKKNQEYKEYPVNITSHPKKRFVKCRPCCEKDSILRNFQICEVWDRVCGYYRSVTQFNPGKKAERKDKKYFKLK